MTVFPIDISVIGNKAPVVSGRRVSYQGVALAAKTAEVVAEAIKIAILEKTNAGEVDVSVQTHPVFYSPVFTATVAVEIRDQWMTGGYAPFLKE